MIFGIFHGSTTQEFSSPSHNEKFGTSDKDESEEDYISDFGVYNYFRNHDPKEVIIQYIIIKFLLVYYQLFIFY
jgi:hypothetical protein